MLRHIQYLERVRRTLDELYYLDDLTTTLDEGERKAA
jgi:hypothetical protein